MKKTSYLKELSITATCKKGTGNNKTDVTKIQGRLNVFAMRNPFAGTATGIDGDFGSGTEAAVKAFQKAANLPQTGTVTQALFKLMCNPLELAFTKTVASNNLRELIVNACVQHLQNAPFEVTTAKIGNNSGPWVRAYMDGKEGTSWFWCMGFVQAMIDQAASQLGKDFTKLMPWSYSCDTVATHAKTKGWLIENKTIRSNPTLVKPGDVFLLESKTGSNDWIHTGIVTAVKGDLFETIEGNTNTDGSHNGNGVYKRTRNFRAAELDVFSIEAFV